MLRTGSNLVFGLICLPPLAAFAASPCGVTATGLRMYGAKVTLPFSATMRTTHELKFADGNAIHGEIETHQYRDSAGRTRMEGQNWQCEATEDGKLQPTLHISIQDPVTRTEIFWSTGAGESVATLQRAPQTPAAPSPRTPQQVRRSMLDAEYHRRNTHNQNLGTRVIEGILCDGSRTVTTTPAGFQGNDLPMVRSEEIWIARDLRIAMLYIVESEQEGRTVIEVTQLDQHEPDAALFAPPAGYKIAERLPNQPPPQP